MCSEKDDGRKASLGRCATLIKILQRTPCVTSSSALSLPLGVCVSQQKKRWIDSHVTEKKRRITVYTYKVEEYLESSLVP
jgi:hypothetical protein